MSNVKDFLKRKDIVITPQRYLIEALGAMAQGLFASLLIGTIIKTLGQQTGLDVLVDLGGYATAMSGPAMACAIGWALHCPPLVLFSLITVGYSANALGGHNLCCLCNWDIPSIKLRYLKYHLTFFTHIYNSP